MTNAIETVELTRRFGRVGMPLTTAEPAGPRRERVCAGRSKRRG